MFRARTPHEDNLFHYPDCWEDDYHYYRLNQCIVPAGANLKDALHQAVTRAYQEGRDCLALSCESARDFTTLLANYQDYMNSWRYGSVSRGGYRSFYSADTNLIYIYELKYRK